MIIEHGVELVCGRCGVVHDILPSGQAAWSEPVRYVESDEKRWRLYKLDRMLTCPNDRTHAMIEAACSKCGIPDAARKRAASLHARILSHDLHRGWNMEARVAAVVALACRLEGVPRSMKVICDAVGVKPGQAHHVYGAVVMHLGISVPPPDPSTYIGSIAASCGIPEAVRRRAAGLLLEHVAQLSGKDPTTLAAAALYVACGDRGHIISQQKLAAAARVSTVSMRLRCRDLEAAAGRNTSNR